MRCLAAKTWSRRLWRSVLYARLGRIQIEPTFLNVLIDFTSRFKKCLLNVLATVILNIWNSLLEWYIIYLLSTLTSWHWLLKTWARFHRRTLWPLRRLPRECSPNLTYCQWERSPCWDLWDCAYRLTSCSSDYTSSCKYVSTSTYIIKKTSDICVVKPTYRLVMS